MNPFGRPKMDPGYKLGKDIRVRIREGDYAAIKAAAARHSMTVAKWVRLNLVALARRS